MEHICEYCVWFVKGICQNDESPFYGSSVEEDKACDKFETLEDF
jgi:hypothetical protein